MGKSYSLGKLGKVLDGGRRGTNYQGRDFFDNFYSSGRTQIRDMPYSQKREMQRYDNYISRKYGVENVGVRTKFKRMNPSIGGATDLRDGTRTYNSAADNTSFEQRGIDYRDIVEHENWHTVQKKFAKKHGLNLWELVGIKSLLEGQTASIHHQNIYNSEQIEYNSFMKRNGKEIRESIYETILCEVFGNEVSNNKKLQKDLIIIGRWLDNILGSKYVQAIGNKIMPIDEKKVYNYLLDLENYAEEIGIRQEHGSTKSCNMAEQAEKEFSFSF